MRLSLLHESVDDFMPKSRACAQFGDCSIEVYFIAKEAVKAGFRDFKVIDGMVRYEGKIFPHSWIETADGDIKDPTVSQFWYSDKLEYSPEGEYRDEFTPEEYIRNFEGQYGDMFS